MNYLKIESSSLSNGTGWRVVLWVSGCNHGCFNCHNPESWSPTSGKPYTDKQKQKIIELLSHKYIKGLTPLQLVLMHAMHMHEKMGMTYILIG